MMLVQLFLSSQHWLKSDAYLRYYLYKMAVSFQEELVYFFGGKRVSVIDVQYFSLANGITKSRNIHTKNAFWREVKGMEVASSTTL